VISADHFDLAVRNQEERAREIASADVCLAGGVVMLPGPFLTSSPMPRPILGKINMATAGIGSTRWMQSQSKGPKMYG
jgi:hypothetical protein